MARTRSSARSTPVRDLGYDAPKRPPTPQVIEIEDDSSEQSVDDVPTDGNLDDTPSDNESRNHSPLIQINGRTTEIVDLVDTSPSPSVARRRLDFRATEVNVDTVRHVHTEMEIDQEELLVVEDSHHQHHSHVQGHLRQTSIEDATEITTRAQGDESPSSRSSTDPETPRRSPVTTNNNQSPLLNSTWETVTRMSKRIKQGLCKDDKKHIGFAYLLDNHHEKTGRFKIGSSNTKEIQRRVDKQIPTCNLQGWEANSFPKFPLRGYTKLEKIAHDELHFMNERGRCVCNTNHREFFRGEKEVARGTLEFWAQWLESCKPYDGDGELLPFWIRRLDMLKNKRYYDHYFQCLDPSCQRDSSVHVCRGCLRAGWTAWTELEDFELEDPELEDQEPEEATRKTTEQSSPMAFSLFNIICILAVISFVTECIPLVDPNGIRKIQSLLILCLWVYKGITGPAPEVFTVKSNQKPHEGLAKTPKKQSTVTGTVRTAPARLNTSRNAELPGNTPVGMSPQEQIPETEPTRNTYYQGPRESATDESPSKAALTRKQKSRRNRRSTIEQALEKTFKLPSMQELQ